MKRALLLVTLTIVITLLVPGIAQATTNRETSIHIVTWGESLTSISLKYDVNSADIVALNELVSPDRIYAGQRLIIPQGNEESPLEVEAISSSVPRTHIVQPGESLYRISLRYGLTTKQLMTLNNLTNDTVRVGQTLFVGTDATPTTVDPSQLSGDNHIVSPGETLFSIGRLYNVSVDSISTVNNLINPSQIYVGQHLLVPGASSTPISGYTPTQSANTHTIQVGETLHSIGNKYGVSPWTLAQTNNISNSSLIYPGQILTVPASNALTAPTQPVPEEVLKSIVVDVSEQRTYVYENDQIKYTFVVSTGQPGADTWRGSYNIQNKIPNAYASTWDLQMPYWLGFYWAGPLQNGFHALPILSNGFRLWESLLGSPASYGCVILSEADARILYNWTEVGTPVTVKD